MSTAVTCLPQPHHQRQVIEDRSSKSADTPGFPPQLRLARVSLNGARRERITDDGLMLYTSHPQRSICAILGHAARATTPPSGAPASYLLPPLRPRAPCSGSGLQKPAARRTMAARRSAPEALHGRASHRYHGHPQPPFSREPRGDGIAPGARHSGCPLGVPGYTDANGNGSYDAGEAGISYGYDFNGSTTETQNATSHALYHDDLRGKLSGVDTTTDA